jgi:hypothetical protein
LRKLHALVFSTNSANAFRTEGNDPRDSSPALRRRVWLAGLLLLGVQS